jgi:hypothetical protein
MKIEVNVLRSRFNYIIANHLALIINRENDELGTGLFAEIEKRRFVITAQHVLDGAADDQIYINLGIERQEHIFKKLNRWTNPDLDLAFLELDYHESEIMRDKIEPFVMRFKRTLGETPNFNGIAICGYPRTGWKRVRNYLTADSFTIALQKPLDFDLWPQRAKEIFNPNEFFMVSLKEEHCGYKILDENGKTPEGIDPHGMSGSPVWLFNASKVNDDQPDYAFWGIYTGYLKEDPSILKATFINKIVENIEQQYRFTL